MPVPALAMRCLARVNRAAIVGVDTRKAAAIDAVGTPHPRRSVERDLGLLVDGRMAAQHDEAQLVVGDDRGVDDVVIGARPRRHVRGEGRHPLAEADEAPDAVDGPAAGGGQQPRLHGVRDAVLGPRLQGQQEGVGGRLLGDVDVASHAQRAREHAAPVEAVGRRRGRRRVRHPAAKSQIGRTSM